jgi:hypothetical protein
MVIFIMKMVQWIDDVPWKAIPLVVNIGNGLGKSLFLMVTLIVFKKAGLPRRKFILLKLTFVSSFEEWSILEVGAGQSFPLEMV